MDVAQINFYLNRNWHASGNYHFVSTLGMQGFIAPPAHRER
ncbi:hypothetical protein BN130_2475 [Cronobacter malonaticus 507]|nr:hypothetical protein BN130_2475 [Cronobacter malonaticus 507]